MFNRANIAQMPVPHLGKRNEELETLVCSVWFVSMMEICECQPGESSMSAGGAVSFHGGVVAFGFGQGGNSSFSKTSSGAASSSAGFSGVFNGISAVRTGKHTTRDAESVGVTFGIKTCLVGTCKADSQVFRYDLEIHNPNKERASRKVVHDAIASTAR